LNIQNNEESAISIDENDSLEFTQKQLDDLLKKSQKISEGADVFLKTEYLYLFIFVSVFALLLFFVGEHKMWTAYVTSAFLVGALTSMLCGFIGMKIATASNYRTTYSAL
jgi:Na+/H+-translocating membrane pyrophosphatase